MLHYHLYDLAPDFDFLTSEPPRGLKDIFGDQLKRARALLSHRTPAEINYIIDSLDWMLRDGGELLLDYSLQVCNIEGECFVSRTKALKLLRDAFEITDQKSLPNATWTDYFAVLSIAYLAEMINELEVANRQASDDPNPDRIPVDFQSKYLKSLGYIHVEWALESMDAVCYAEQLNKELEWRNQKPAQAEIDTTVKELRREWSRKGGKNNANRHAPLREEVLRRAREHYADRSAHKAANCISDDLYKEGIRISIQEYSHITQFAKWIRNDRKRVKQENNQTNESNG